MFFRLAWRLCKWGKSLPKWSPLRDSTQWVSSALTRKYETNLIKLGKEKRSSLFCRRKKSFILSKPCLSHSVLICFISLSSHSLFKNDILRANSKTCTLVFFYLKTSQLIKLAYLLIGTTAILVMTLLKMTLLIMTLLIMTLLIMTLLIMTLLIILYRRYRNETT
jgi:hypothetical protein